MRLIRMVLIQLRQYGEKKTWVQAAKKDRPDETLQIFAIIQMARTSRKSKLEARI